MLRIPRVFHRIWLGGLAMPREFVQFGESWLAHHPGWSMYTWTDEFAAHLCHSDTLRRSKAKSGKANVLRYEILRRYGGVYVDTDFECLKNIEPILQDVSCFVGLQGPEVANNAIIGAVPGHPFLQDLVDNIPARVKALAGGLSIKQSGPYYLTERLQYHRGVTVFPPWVFYPYQWHERWRRHERFPSAYGVHHWALSWRKRRTSVPCTTTPQSSVLLVNFVPDVPRLRWVLEGLCEQTAAGSFEVVLLDHSRQECIRTLSESYASRIRITYAPGRSVQHGLVSGELQHYARRCKGERVILLDGRCVPDPGLVESHGRLGTEAIVGSSNPRIYPAEKFFSFTPPLDYDSLRMHAAADARYSCLKSGGARDHWRNVREGCISVPREVFAAVSIPAEVDRSAGGKWLARELSFQNHQVVALNREAQVTRLT